MSYKTLLTVNGIEFKENEPSKDHVTMKAGGEIKYFVIPKCIREAVHAFSGARMTATNALFLGNGSNTVFSDNGFDGAVISTKELKEITVNGNEITAECGALLSRLATVAADASLTGLEFAHGIPGSVGGAVFMNAGAYGGEMKDVLKSVTLFDGSNVKTVNADEIFFGYRETDFSNHGWLVLSATFLLKKGNQTEIKEKMKELAALRREKQPLELPSCGSAFKRPEGHFAGKLIEDAGLKGFTVGNMQVSKKHAGFIVNIGGGTETELEEIIEKVTEKVYEKFGVTLKPEIRIIR